ncbi:DUF4942 domain-containing protein [Methylobacterium sp. D53M]
MSALIRKESVDELCAHRARAIALYEVAVQRLGEAMEAHERACQMGGRATLPFLGTDSNDRWSKLPEFIGKIQTRMDRDIWRGIVVGTPIGSLMDAQERKAFEQSLDKDPPPATAENVRATLERLIGESDTIFRRGLVNAFKALDREYASNDGFKLGERIVLTWGIYWDKNMNWFSLHERRTSELLDVDRVMHVLDGKPAPSRMQGLISAIDLMCYRHERAGETIAETPYWRVRIFKNGNIHLWPLRRDLLDRANRIIAEHFGMVVPARREARQAQPNYQAKPGQTFAADFFPTPADLAARVVAEAGIEPHHRVLEPSAGKGALAEPIYQIVGGANLVCYEADAERAAACAEWQFDVRCRDFLAEDPAPIYDRVVMNPPFSKRQDVRHVLHALRFLKPGGRLVAIVSGSVPTRADTLTAHLRHVVERQGGTIERLPAGSFKASGTDVNACLIVVEAAA